jgi:hypothetical protein
MRRKCLTIYPIEKYRMRIWSLHPKYLDAKGLVAVWRETLLAKHVLEGKTKGYTQHPQLSRFRKCHTPLEAVNHYLSEIFVEASARNYRFDRQKIDWNFRHVRLTVNAGQMQYEKLHLLKKLKLRDKEKYKEVRLHSSYDPHPIFTIVDGPVEDWEII